MGWIGTVEVNQDTGSEPGETQCLTWLEPGASIVLLEANVVPLISITLSASAVVGFLIWKEFLLAENNLLLSVFAKIDESSEADCICSSTLLCNTSEGNHFLWDSF